MVLLEGDEYVRQKRDFVVGIGLMELRMECLDNEYKEILERAMLVAKIAGLMYPPFLSASSNAAVLPCPKTSKYFWRRGQQNVMEGKSGGAGRYVGLRQEACESALPWCEGDLVRRNLEPQVTGWRHLPWLCLVVIIAMQILCVELQM